MLSGNIMSGNVPVCSFEGRRVTTLRPEMAPLCFRKGGDLEWWLGTRAIDRHRTNSRALKKILRLGDTSDLNTVLRVHGATITDNFWVRTSEEETLCWEDVRFSEDIFADLALTGSADSITRTYTPEHLRTPTPELTNTGSYEKCWKRINEKWTMLKLATTEELFSEIFIYRLGKKLGFHMAEYFALDGYSASPDFTSGCVNFEPAANLVGENEDYEFVYDALMTLSPDLVQQYLDILFMDALVLNVDRHTQNFGFLRNQTSGEIIGMAPNFDNNMALISRGYAADPEHFANPLAEMFIDLLHSKGIPYSFPSLSQDIVNDIANSVLPEADIDRDYVQKFVWTNYRKLGKIQNQD